MTTRPTLHPTRTRARTRATAGAGALALGLLLAGCGGQDSGAGTATEERTGASPSSTASSEADATQEPSQESSQEPEDEGTVIDVTIEGGDVSPKGERVRVAVGEPITFRVTSDVADEAHVHATPDQEFAITPGRSEHVVTVATPGLVEVELHDLGITLVQLEAR